MNGRPVFVMDTSSAAFPLVLDSNTVFAILHHITLIELKMIGHLDTYVYLVSIFQCR